LKEGGRDGTLVVVSRDLSKAVKPQRVASTLQTVLDNWPRVAPKLKSLSDDLNAGKAEGAFALDPAKLAAPLPRAFQWLDGSAYLVHAERVRRSRGAELPASAYQDALMYQGGSDAMLGPRDDIVMGDEAWGIDYEAEIVAITDDVKMGADAAHCAERIRLLTIVNDVSLRGLIPAELAKGFGFLVSKPSTGFAPVMVTPDELGDAWRGGTIHLPLVSTLNGKVIGQPNAGADMNFTLPQLIAHAAKTRVLSAGTIVGSGTVANRDETRGCSCIAEIRAIETIKSGKPETPFLRFGDTIKIEMLDAAGRSIFGAIEQKVVKYGG
jgi:fumarylacetoacetate (FAA) hydrolase